MIKLTTLALANLLEGVRGRFTVRRVVDIAIFNTGERLTKVPAYWDGEYKMVHEQDLQEGILYARTDEFTFESSDKTGSGDGEMNANMVVVGFMRRIDLDCPEVGGQDVADNIVKQIAGRLQIAEVGGVWVDVVLVETDAATILNSEFDGTMPWSDEIVCARVTFRLNVKYKNRCLTDRTVCA